MSRLIVNVEGKQLSLTNLEKVLYPSTGFTKGGVIDYYRRVAPVILPHLRGRPLTLKRYPEGVHGFHFYEKRCPSFRPDWINSKQVHTFSKRGVVPPNYCIVNDLPALVWVVNLASIELHTLLFTTEAVNCPLVTVFDLDPGEGTDIIDCSQVALIMREMLKGAGLQSFPKTSGGKGLHLYVPLNTTVTSERAKKFARTVAQVLEKNYPERITSSMKKSDRKGKIFVDWSQNDEHKTTVAVYSLRAHDRPSVSTPVSWEELELAVRKNKKQILFFEHEQVLERIDIKGDLFESVLTLKQSLP